MKIALAQLNYHIGNFENNVAKIKSAIVEAQSKDTDLIVFAELAICGYPPRDFLEFDDFIDHCESALKEIASDCKNIAAIVGAPSRNLNIDGKPLYNSAYFLHNGRVQQVIHKTLLPTYDIFDEYRYFEPNNKFKTVEYQGKRIVLTICEDIWDKTLINEGSNSRKLYTKWPLDELKSKNPDLIINIAASPFNYEQAAYRKEIMVANAIKYNLPLVYVNHVGAQTELIFDGGSMAVNAKGNISNSLPFFEEGITYFNTDNETNTTPNTLSKTESIHQGLVLGIRDYFKKLGFKQAVLGLSGGIDSAVVCALATEALGAENVLGVLMPSQFSSKHSVEDAQKLCDNLGISSKLIPIKTIFDEFQETLKPYFHELPFGLAEENLQARSRGVILMALSNKFGHILLNTSNKSEKAVGYGTLYGDMCGGLAPLGDVYKTEVFELANHINRNGEIVPRNTINKPPSAELRPDQKDSDSLPDYDILDQVLFQYIELKKSPKEIIDIGFEESLVKRVLKLVNISEYKRFQSPPILRVSPKAFGMGRRMPIVGKYLS